MSSGSCAACNKALPLQGTFVQAGGLNFHHHCFSCATCNRQIDGLQYKVKDGRITCTECGSKVCDVCCQPITGKHLMAESKYYHLHCFTCNVCAETMTHEYTIAGDGRRICSRCDAPRCYTCSGMITKGQTYFESDKGQAQCMRCHTDGLGPVRMNYHRQQYQQAYMAPTIMHHPAPAPMPAFGGHVHMATAAPVPIPGYGRQVHVAAPAPMAGYGGHVHVAAPAPMAYVPVGASMAAAPLPAYGGSVQMASVPTPMASMAMTPVPAYGSGGFGPCVTCGSMPSRCHCCGSAVPAQPGMSDPMSKRRWYQM